MFFTVVSCLNFVPFFNSYYFRNESKEGIFSEPISKNHQTKSKKKDWFLKDCKAGIIKLS